MKLKQLEDMTEPELAELMRSCADAVVNAAKRYLPGKPLFTLLLFNDPAIGQYVSNCNRADMVKALREAANRLEAKQDVPR